MEIETDNEEGHLMRASVKHKERPKSTQGEDELVLMEEGETEKERRSEDDNPLQRQEVRFTWVPHQPVKVSSFRDVVAGSTQWFQQAKQLVQATMEWDEEELEIPDSSLDVSFSKEKLQRLREPWRNTLMAKVLGMSINRNFLVDRVNRMWKTKDRLEVIDLGQDIFLLKFHNGDDMERALYGGPWFILNQYLMLTKWKPDFRPSSSTFDKIMVWIRLPELPLDYYEKDALFAIAEKVGKPIKVDYATDTVARGRYARVCIELELSKALVTKVWVAKEWQAVEYENLNMVCFNCGLIGHRKDQCSTHYGKIKDPVTVAQDLHREAEKNVHKVNRDGEVVIETPLVEPGKEKEEANGETHKILGQSIPDYMEIKMQEKN